MSAEFSLAVQFASDADNLPSRAQIRRWVAAALEHAAEITVRIVDAEEAQALNQDYRKKGYVPNVLTFEYGEVSPGVLGGDVVICAPVVEREAREQGKPLKDHYAHMTVHGVLHLQGYDHIDPADADIMESREAVILRRFRIPNPYLSFPDENGVRQ
ncbi:rRNA maturation RNase YbeY [Thiobacillus sp.]|uniref:rRNA maturation RNase YbeY n=1 Tax=Thiobacillus sp. TaxID=924 RepID=UPI00086A518D|nr:rRNA maturation RNase YbeY [Thiobacillus sp.]MBN8779024.1 rRNA maturation RNase YbeY [Thiobacillus sp.]ODU85985.1 MAG: rRNA maturation RNase YbeY [Thiobacillus sp. SCN 65-179]